MERNERFVIDPDEIRSLLSGASIEGVEVVADGKIEEVVLYLFKNGKKYRISINAIDSSLYIVVEE